MNENIDFAGRDILLDTNLLVILIIGFTNPLLFKSSRFAEYKFSDFELLREITVNCRRCLTTPSIIAEASNIFDKAGYWAEACRKILAKLLQEWVEVYIESKQLLSGPDSALALTLGVADGSTLGPARGGALILTADGPLAAWLSNMGQDVQEFKVIRNIWNNL